MNMSCPRDRGLTRRASLRRLAALGLLAGGTATVTSACGGTGDSARSGIARARTLHDGLSSPWGLAFLPDGRLLVTQKGGSMLLLNAAGTQTLATLTGVPAVVSSGQGGLLDVALDPDFASDPYVYWSYSEAGTGGSGTAVARGRLVGTALQNVQVIFRQQPKLGGNGHFGSRLVFRSDKTLFVTLGERQADSPSNPTRDNAQNLAKTLGKVVRIQRDGSIPADNPDFGVAAALPGIWSLGHRNPQGAALRPGSDELWLVEHGPRGGDELNRVLPGRNYGWPLRSYGCDYSHPQSVPACRPGGGTHAPDFVEPVATWLPISIAPSGLAFYTGDKFPEWRGNAFLGALAGEALWRVGLDGNAEASRERLFGNLGERIRCVRQGPDGWLYLLSDGGKLLRVERA